MLKLQNQENVIIFLDKINVICLHINIVFSKFIVHPVASIIISTVRNMTESVTPAYKLDLIRMKLR